MPGVSPIGGLARADGQGQGGSLRRSVLLGAAGARVRRPGGPRAHPGPGAGGPRREPDRPHLHGRPVGRLPLRVVVPHRLREPAHQRLARRRARPAWRVRVRRQPMRAAREQAHAAGARPVPAVPRAGDRRAGRAPGDRGAGVVRVGRRVASAPRQRPVRALTQAAVRSWGGGPGRTDRRWWGASTRASRTRSRASSPSR